MLFNHGNSQKDYFIYGVCFSHKKPVVRPSNTMHDTTVAVFEEKVCFNDNHRLETRISPYAWCQGNDTLLCPMPTSVQRTAVWPVLRVPRLYAPV